MSQPATLTWFARHELSLAWRDWLAMMTAGKRRRERKVAIVLVVLAALLHLLAYGMVGGFAEISRHAREKAGHELAFESVRVKRDGFLGVHCG